MVLHGMVLRSIRGREPNGNSASEIGLGVYSNGTPMSENDLLGEAKSQPDPAFLGREVRSEKSTLGLGVHPVAIVLDLQQNTSASRRNESCSNLYTRIGF